MPIPVLIPAKNEAESIGYTLLTLRSHDVEPIVIANACTDATAIISKYLGVQVIELEQPSKTLALHTGLRHLGSRALEPLLTLDADSQPISPRWTRLMMGALKRGDRSRPATISGQIIFRDGSDILSDMAHTVRSFAEQSYSRLRGKPSNPYGANMLIHLQHSATLESVLDITDYWPGDDRALRDMVVMHQGRDLVVFNPLAAVVTDGWRNVSIMRRIRQGHQASHDEMLDSYLSEAPPGSVPYES